MTTSLPTTPDAEIADRRTVLHLLTQLVDSGLPAPQEVQFLNEDHLWLNFDGGVTDADAWTDTLKLSYCNSQPWPLDGNYEMWTSSSMSATDWHGWKVSVRTHEPITATHIDDWVISGRAARRAEYVARLAAEAAAKAEQS